MSPPTASSTKNNGRGRATKVANATAPAAAKATPTAAAKARPRTEKTKGKEYVASLHPGPETPLPAKFADGCEKLSRELGLPIWLLVQRPHEEGHSLGALEQSVRDGFFHSRRELANCKGAALVIDSPGGYAGDAYEIARLFQRHCGNFVAVVPRRAKSAATLVTLGATILMAEDAQLGPLDAQVWDPEREEYSSALNEVQALERLHTQAVEEIDQMVPLLVGRTGKKMETILPLVLDFVAKMKRPLLEKIDTVHYTQQSRSLKEAEDYAIRLLTASRLYPNPRNVAARLVNRYSDHGFVIDRSEASEFLRIIPPKTTGVTEALATLADYLTDNKLLAVGRFRERSSSP
jgi:Serine dehydrogenase proteinase